MVRVLTKVLNNAFFTIVATLKGFDYDANVLMPSLYQLAGDMYIDCIALYFITLYCVLLGSN